MGYILRDEIENQRSSLFKATWHLFAFIPQYAYHIFPLTVKTEKDGKDRKEVSLQYPHRLGST